MLIEAGFGPGSLDEIEVFDFRLLERGRDFSHPDVTITGISPKVRVFQGTDISCPWGCRGLVRGVIDAYVDLYGPEDSMPMNVILGKPGNGLPDGLDPESTLVLGDCAAPHRQRGQFVEGCCPRPLDVGLVVRRIMGAVRVEIGFTESMRAYTGHNLWRLSRFLTGKKLKPIENQLPFSRVVKEYIQTRNLRRKQDIV